MVQYVLFQTEQMFVNVVRVVVSSLPVSEHNVHVTKRFLPCNWSEQLFVNKL
jgi:hypothetical protein